MTTYLGKSCSFGLPRVPFVNCRQFMYLVIFLLVLRAGCGICLYQFLIIAYLFTFHFLTACVSLSFFRQPYNVEIEKRLLWQNTASRLSSVLACINLLAQLVIDYTSKVISDRLTLADPEYCEIEIVFRKLCFALHLKRCSLMKQLCSLNFT